ncbi:TetR/AcrR family transcriptional regulator [Flavobacterium sp. NKUCC04_CG]|uniref:TetR/AcrR family transcriptional regulator n=1 Tax=Flavobacterium sp. NKUCC04_CG TaxID=2842121 RepID=UPI001C5AA6D8|nr:TetR/AcrR family transcriptional regulator [Flavobacterium sp. NKUCC04_CG]MBW3519193.1 TetR/AcrR family transcriptional regulator [Flavobacterium sp. NKUCC04_CG]
MNIHLHLHFKFKVMRARNLDKQKTVKENAIAMIGQGGLENFSINKLAKISKVSVATIYIYYKDKDDLIFQLTTEQGAELADLILKDFSPDMSFEAGLRQQWINRYHQMMHKRDSVLFMVQVKSSSYYRDFLKVLMNKIKQQLNQFLENAINRQEIDRIPLEVYWSIAHAPLYSLIKFHYEEIDLEGKPYQLDESVMWQTFDLVVRALKKNHP